MPTCSIFDDITINNPAFIEMYVDHMDAKDGESTFVRRTNSNIRILTPEEGKRLSELRKKRREEQKMKEEGKEHGEQDTRL